MSNYVLLWDVSSIIPDELKKDAEKKAEVWPGFPKERASPNPININISNQRPPVIPIPSFEQRNTKRNGGYASLSNYNKLP